MATSSYVPQSLHLLSKTRYEKPFEVLYGYLNVTLPTRSTGSGFLEGTVVDINASGNAVVAASGALGIGFALQTVRDMSAQNGYRNYNKTEAALGENIGVIFGDGVAATMIHEGSGNVGDYAWWDGSTLQFDAEPPSGVAIIGRLLQADGSNPGAGVRGTAGDYLTASSKKAIVLFNFKIQ